jgi:hypothetical protein
LDALSLCRTVAGFIGEGLIAGQAGDLQMLDAHEVLNCFMVDRLPDARRFEDTMKPIMDRTAASRKHLVRAYGEMVDVLWMTGREAAAVSLAVLWNQLIARGDQHSHVVGERRM